MKRFLSAGIGLALAGLLACDASRVEGTYYNVDNAKEYLELKNNGEFYLKAGAMDLAGKYAVDDKTITLNPKTRVAATGKLENGVIVDSDGTRWRRQ